MKKIFLFMVLLAPAKAIAPDIRSFNIVRIDVENIYERLIKAIIQVESGGDTLAYNPVEQAYGAFQIRPIRLMDYNQRTGKSYQINDCMKMAVSREIFLYYASRNHSSFEMISRNWNGSGEMTLIYWNKVKSWL